MRTTKHKELIKKIINNSYSHPSAYQIYEKCLKEIPNISLGTVYRNLNALVEANEIQRLKMPNNVDKYDKMIEHSHFICLKCNKVIDLENRGYSYENYINGNRVLNCKICFEGICNECQEEGECNYGTKRK